MHADGTARGRGGSGCSVLLVEDNAAMRALIRSLVEEVTPRIRECQDGERAVELYPRLRPDCVLMDIQMPGAGGIAATRAILRIDPAAHIIMVTEHGDGQHRQAALESGARGFVLKDRLLDLPALIRAIPAG